MSDQIEDRAASLNATLRRVMEDYADLYEATEGGKATMFVSLAEIATPDGSRALIEMNAGAMDDEGLVSWLRDGLLFNALHDQWYRRDRGQE